MRPLSRDSLDLGTNVLEELLPHSRPMLLVDRVLTFRDGEEPELEACKYISSNEPVFEGHFRRLHLWPGIYTQEGMGQAALLLSWILEGRRLWKEEGGDPDQVLAALKNLELGYRLHPGFDPDMARILRDRFPREGFPLGMSSAVDLKFLQPVFAGCRLDFSVRLTHRFQNQIRFQVLATVEDTPVARGTLMARAGLTIPTAVTEG